MKLEPTAWNGVWKVEGVSGYRVQWCSQTREIHVLSGPRVIRKFSGMHSLAECRAWLARMDAEDLRDHAISVSMSDDFYSA